MANFGLGEMRLVTPRDGWPNPSAGPAAAGADFILDKAQVFETTADAVADCAHVFATTVRKRGRRIGLIDVELTQDGRTAVRAAITMGVPEHHVPPLLSDNPVVPLMTPEPPPGLEPIGPGHRMADVVHLAHGCDIRPSLTTFERRSDGGPPLIEYWVKPKGTAPDVLFALLCGDVSAPVTFGVNRFGWAPTVQLTAYLRATPADGWLRVLCTTTQIGQDWFDEDHIVVDCEGRIIVQTRQLALVPAAQS